MEFNFKGGHCQGYHIIIIGVQIEFDKCVDLYKDFIEPSNDQLESNISAVKTGTGNSKPSGTVATLEITDRYYTVREYRTLTPE